MLIKFETKSTRVKGLAFHPRRKWILASLHNGVIQLWDYSEKTMIDKFDEHKGPVRGLDFHKHQPLFVSGGDDAKVKVWDYKLRKCIFTLDAHEDYIRTTYFHHENPWILSASDDQSIRIWNWQSRSRIAVLTGHTHYVMCAQFHPSAELILSASIDQTLRLWDIRVLQIKNTASALPSKEELGTGLPEILTKTDYSVESKDAHMSEINWCAFHPTKDLCLSAADDNYIKVWRAGPRGGISELYTLRGHYNNVNCAIFHPRKDLILSASEDRSIRVWDLDKRIPLCTHRKDVDRFWTVAAHPKENLFAAGHDTGLMVFKTERERPAHVVVKDIILYIKGDHIWKLNMKTGERRDFAKLKAKSELGHYYHRIHCYSFDEGQSNQVLVSIRSNHSELNVYDLYKVYRNESDPTRGKGSSALFVGKNRYAVIEWPSRVTFKVNGEEKKPKTPIVANDIFEAGPGRLFLRQKKTDTTEATVSLYDIERAQTINSIKIDAKRVIMSDNRDFVACIETNKITICDGQLNILCPIVEQRKIKSAVWDDNGVLIYTTPCHVKYALSDGHTTTIRSVEETLYAMAVTDNKLFCIDKAGDIKQIPLDTREFRFKQAVIKNDRAGILASLRQLAILTEAEITFLVKKGHPGLALTKVEDPQKKFTLALLAFNIDEALKAAIKIDSKQCWTQLVEVAMQVGHVKAAEMALKRLKKPYQLAMLYLVCGQRHKMLEARALAKELCDTSTEFIISLLAKDFLECAKIIKRCGQPTLAYTCAVNHGLYDLAQEISEELSEEQLMLLPPLESARKNTSWMDATIPEICDTDKDIENWPLLNDEQENVDAVLNAEPDVEMDMEDKGGWDDDDELGSSSERLAEDDEEEKLEDAQDDGWSEDEPLEDVLDDLADEDEEGPTARVEQKKDVFVAPNPGQSLASSWAQLSDLALHHVLAGSYKSAFRLLQSQVGAINPKPLEPIFEDLFRQSRAAYQAFPLFSTMYTYPISNKEFIGDIPLPLGGYSIEDLNKRLALSYNLFSAAKFDDAIKSFRNLLLCTLFLRISGSSESSKKEAKKMISISREYILGLQVWLEKKNITGKEFEDHKRACELAAYFAKLNMSKHRSKVLEKALGAFVARSVPENFRKTHAAASIARRLLDHLSASDPKKATIVGIAEKVKASPDVQVDQEIQLDYDDQNPYSLCAATFRPIYKGNQLTECPLCDAKYKPDYSGETCKVCLLSQIGKHSSGIRFEATNYDE